MSSPRARAIRGGFLQVHNNQVSVLTPEAAMPEELTAAALDQEFKALASEAPVKPPEREALDKRRAWLSARQRVMKDSPRKARA